MKRIFSGVLLMILLASMLYSAFNILPAVAQITIYIRADGSIDPPTPLITTLDSIIYTFTSNIDGSIVVERNNIAIDGTGYALQGTLVAGSTGIDLTGRTNVTIQNIHIRNFDCGIFLASSNNNIISGNNIINNINEGVAISSSNYNWVNRNNIANNNVGVSILSPSTQNSVSDNKITNNNGVGIFLESPNTNNNFIAFNNITANWGGISVGGPSNNIRRNNIVNTGRGIGLCAYSKYNEISENNIAENNYGVWDEWSSFNGFYGNSFIDNDQQVRLRYPNPYPDSRNWYGSGGGIVYGNYWSDYETRYPDAHENPAWPGTWDTPYIIDQRNYDEFPLISLGPLGYRDVAIKNITTTKSGCLPFETVGAGEPITFKTTIRNQGNYNETFAVRLWANETMIAELAVVDLMPLNTILWKLNDIIIGGAKGNITIKANATIFAEEMHAEDNTYTYGYVYQTLSGDVDGDRDVDIDDFIRISGAYGTVVFAPGYDPNSDITNNEVIDVFDIFKTGRNYGKNW